MERLEPTKLAARQVALDRARTARFPQLFDRKVARMRLSALAFLRGSAPLFYEVLDARPELVEGPKGSGWIAGDLHVENFGAYRCDLHGHGDVGEAHVEFGLNDFDEAVIGPWRIELLRLVTSTILAARALGVSGLDTMEIAHGMIDAYCTATSSERVPRPPACVSQLVARVGARTRKQLLDARTVVQGKSRRFVRGERYKDVPTKLRKASREAFARYTKRLAPAECPKDHHLEVVDLALRIAGTGSLGCFRVAVLVSGKGGRDGGWIFDMKEQGPPAALALGKLVSVPKKLAPAERVAEAVHASLGSPPRQVGTTRLGKTSLFVRRLAPQEDKLDLAHVPRAELAPLARHLGALTGAAHAHAAVKKPKRPWSEEDRDAILARATMLAGVHEAAYLAYCRATK